MIGQKQTYRNWPLRIGLAVVIATMFSVYLFGNLNAKFIVNDPGRDGARVAAFAFNLKDGASSKVIDLAEAIEKPGDSASYTFAVNTASEVTVRYWLQLQYDGSMPLVFSVVQNSTNGANEGGAFSLSTTIEQLNAAITTQGGHTPTPMKANSTRVLLKPNTSGQDSYTLTATWPTTENNLDYANNSVGELTLFAIAEQVD